MPTNAENIERFVIQVLPEDRPPTEKEIEERVRQFEAMFPISEEDRDALLRRLHARLQIRMERGTVIKGHDYVPWLSARKASIVPYYWPRYELFLLRSNWEPKVVRTLDVVTDEILDLFGDPSKEGAWKRRGLVMGDVQSGKTATYTGLCCKASDAGYRLVVLLTGTLENLRKQTQERLDAGFVGLDSSGFLSAQRQRREIGVGLIDSSRSGVVFTSRVRDFSTDLVNQLNFRLGSFAEPILLVVKKNKRILENLERWLRQFNANADGFINSPILIIDDEADNASVNTRAVDAAPTAINEAIRALLRLFRRSTYVGFTATPFANIFIDSESTDEMLGDDLFPNDFVYALEPPSNYVGAEKIFASETGDLIIRPIHDAEPFFPAAHKSSHVVDELPDSLYEAIRSFVIVNVIRDLRGEGKSHRSMLVNVSRFTNVQHQVASLIDDFVRAMQRDIQNFARLDPEKALLNANLRSLKDVFDREFMDPGPDWPAVQQALVVAALPIKVIEVNQSTGTAALDYAVYADDGLRVITVGGNSLSRGLTLNGLCISYFFRNSQMYDTLLQMGRWFGYRDGYEDLSRLWLTDDARHWYSHITEATAELRQEIRRMRQLGLTPRDFGLKVREHPDSLIVTARNKMRAARTIERNVSLSAQGPETPRLYTDRRIIADNASVVRTFITHIEGQGAVRRKSPYGNSFWSDVPAGAVVDLLRGFRVHPLNLTFQSGAIADFLESTSVNGLKSWDVVLPNGSEDPCDLLLGLVYEPQRRVVSTPSSTEILVSGRSARVGSRGIEREGIDADTVKSVGAEYLRANQDKTSVPDYAYRNVRKRPLLILHLIRAYDPEKNLPIDVGPEPLVALGLSFPQFEDDQADRKVKYRVNTVEWRNLFETEIGDEGESEDETP